MFYSVGLSRESSRISEECSRVLGCCCTLQLSLFTEEVKCAGYGLIEETGIDSQGVCVW